MCLQRPLQLLHSVTLSGPLSPLVMHSYQTLLSLYTSREEKTNTSQPQLQSQGKCQHAGPGNWKVPCMEAEQATGTRSAMRACLHLLGWAHCCSAGRGGLTPRGNWPPCSLGGKKTPCNLHCFLMFVLLFNFPKSSPWEFIFLLRNRVRRAEVFPALWRAAYSLPQSG